MVVTTSNISCTEDPEKACTWLRELSSCSCLNALPGPAWDLLSKIYKPFAGALYLYSTNSSELITHSPVVGDPAAHDGEEVLRDCGVECEAALQHVRVQQTSVGASLGLGQFLQLKHKALYNGYRL